VQFNGRCTGATGWIGWIGAIGCTGVIIVGMQFV
jgi:hypothetical protein